MHLSTESVQSSTLSFQCVHNIHGCDCLPLGVLCVCDCITDDIFQENFQHTSSLLIDQSGDTFYTSTTSQTTDGWFCDPLDVITKNFPVTLSASFSKTFSSFSTSSHFCKLLIILLLRVLISSRVRSPPFCCLPSAAECADARGNTLIDQSN